MNIDQIRSETPGLENKLFFNSAGASLMPSPVLEIIRWYLDEEVRYGGYKAAEVHSKLISEFYDNAAELLNCKPENIAFSFNATEAFIRALSAFDFEGGDVIITTDDDYISNHLQFIAMQQRLGIEIKRIRTKSDASLDIDHFEALIKKKRPKLVAVTHVPTNSGLIQDVEAIGKICRREDLIYLVDACQSVGQMAVDVEDIGCDFLSATGRKFLRGPRGTGLLYISDRMLNQDKYPLMIDGTGAEWTGKNDFKLTARGQRFESWEKPYCLLAGLSKALAYLNELGIDNITRRNKELMNSLRGKLSLIRDVDLYDRGDEVCNILTFRKRGKSMEDLKRALDSHNVFYSISPYESGVIDYTKKGINWTCRISPHYFNTQQELELLSGIIEEI